MSEEAEYFKSRKSAVAVALIVLIVGTVLFIVLDAEEKDRIVMEKMALEKASKIANNLNNVDSAQNNKIKSTPLPEGETVESKIQLV